MPNSRQFFVALCLLLCTSLFVPAATAQSSVSTGLKTSAAPAVAEYNGKYYLAYKSADGFDQIHVAEILIDSDNDQIRVGRTSKLNSTTSTGVALHEHDGKLWMAFISHDRSKNIMLKSFDGHSWTHAKRLDFKSDRTPAIASHKGNLTIIWRNLEGSWYTNPLKYSLKGLDVWTDPKTVPNIGWGTGPPRTTDYQGSPYGFFLLNWCTPEHCSGRRRPLSVIHANDYEGWRDKLNDFTGSSDKVPGIEFVPGQLIVATTEGSDGRFWFYSNYDGTWTESSLGFRSLGSPALLRVGNGTRTLLLVTTPTRRTLPSSVGQFRTSMDIKLELIDTKQIRENKFSKAENFITSNQPDGSSDPGAQPEPPPTAPTQLKVVARGGNRYTLRWQDNSVDEDGFRIDLFPERGRLIRFYEAPSRAGTGEQSHTFTAATPYPVRTLCFMVRAYRGRVLNASGPSERKCVRPATTIPPRDGPRITDSSRIPPDRRLAAPTDFKVMLIDENRVRFEWRDNSTGERRFSFEQSSSPRSTTWQHLVTIASAISDIRGVGIRERRYVTFSRANGNCFRVIAVNYDGRSNPSNVVCI